MNPGGQDEPFLFSANTATSTSSHPEEPSGDAILRQTRREVRQLVQEISSLCRSDIPEQRFWSSFLTQLGSAMAADAVLLWQRDGKRWHCRHHCGQFDERLLITSATGSTPPTSSPQTLDTHQRMIAEVGSMAGPVMVPPGAAWDDPEPGNPTDQLAAVVPIPLDLDRSVELLLELFIPPGSTPSAQRGYLRFIAQMADLAADYLRRQRWLTLQQLNQLAARADSFHAKLASLTDSLQFSRALVEGVRDLIDCERVSLVHVPHRGKPRVEAISGASDIDHHAAAVQHIANLAQVAPSRIGFHPPRPVATPTDATPTTTTNTRKPANDELLHDGALETRGCAVITLQTATGPAAGDRAQNTTNTLPGSDADESSDSWRLLLEDSPGTTAAIPVRPTHELEYWPRLATSLGSLLRHHQQAQHRQSWTTRLLRSRTHSPLRRALAPLGVLLTIAIVASLPMPLVVNSMGHLQPRDVQPIYALHDGTIAQLCVAHGQQITAGTPLIRMVNRDLERRSRQLEAQLQMLDDQYAQLELDRLQLSPTETASAINTEMAVNRDKHTSLTSELQILRGQLNELTLTSPCDGVVDAWQIEQHLRGRPIRQGQYLVRVVPPQTTWQIQAEVPQNRLDHVLAAHKAGVVEAQAILSAFPNQPLTTTLREVGPVQTATLAAEPGPVGLVMFDVPADQLPMMQPGAPVELGIPCGPKPIGYVICQDLLRSLNSTIRLYW